MNKTKYYVVKKQALPEVLLKVMEVKRILSVEPERTVQDVTEQVGISRSSFYKYQNEIFPFHENEKGQTMTLMIQMNDVPGLLAGILQYVARQDLNILTIHQSIPLNGVATLTLSVEFLGDSCNIGDVVEMIRTHEGVHDVKILGRE